MNSKGNVYSRPDQRIPLGKGMSIAHFADTVSVSILLFRMSIIGWSGGNFSTLETVDNFMPTLHFLWMRKDHILE